MDISEKSFLITGGAGFIGSHIVEYLLNHKAKFVRVIDNLSTGFYSNIEPFIKFDNFQFVEGDIKDYEICYKCLENIDIVCHQAACGSVPKSFKYPLEYHTSNVTGFLNILHASKEHGIKRFVYASSSSVYGSNITLPKQENLIGKQLSPYALTKYIDELYANFYFELFGMECIGFRYFNVFGPRQNPNGDYAAVIPKFIDKIKKNELATINGDGSFSRDFTYVDNVVNANIKACLTLNDKSFGEVFNIGTGDATSILDLHQKISKNFGYTKKPIFLDQRDGDIPHSLANINKAKEILDYNPTISLEEGLKLTIKFFNN